MNLLNDPSFTELGVLFAQFNSYGNEFYILVEHDGEVLLVDDTSLSHEDLHKFKYFIYGLSAGSLVENSVAGNLKFFRELYTNLLLCWDQKLQGAINYNIISMLRSHDTRSENKSVSNLKIAASFFVSFEKDSLKNNRFTFLNN